MEMEQGVAIGVNPDGIRSWCLILHVHADKNVTNMWNWHKLSGHMGDRLCLADSL